MVAVLHRNSVYKIRDQSPLKVHKVFKSRKNSSGK